MPRRQGAKKIDHTLKRKLIVDEQVCKQISSLETASSQAVRAGEAAVCCTFKCREVQVAPTCYALARAVS